MYWYWYWDGRVEVRGFPPFCLNGLLVRQDVQATVGVGTGVEYGEKGFEEEASEGEEVRSVRFS